MIFGLLVLGVLLISAGLKGNENQLGEQLANDLSGNQNFLGWLGAFATVGVIGYIPGLEKPSRYMIALLLVVILIRNNGVFATAQNEIQQASVQGPSRGTVTPAGQTASTSTSNSGGGSGGGALGGIGNIIGPIATIAGLF